MTSSITSCRIKRWRKNIMSKGKHVRTVPCPKRACVLKYCSIIAAVWYSTKYHAAGEKKEEIFRLTSGAAVWRPVVMRRPMYDAGP